MFSSDFHTPIKNAALAIEAVKNVRNSMGMDVQLIELVGYTRYQVNLLMHAADVCLMTSFTEGSPQFIKEAMACGCPIVTTRVGDAEFVIGNTKGCYFTDYSIDDCVTQITNALQFAKQHNRTDGEQRILQLGYSNDVVAEKINNIYVSLTQKQ